MRGRQRHKVGDHNQRRKRVDIRQSQSANQGLQTSGAETQHRGRIGEMSVTNQSAEKSRRRLAGEAVG